VRRLHLFGAFLLFAACTSGGGEELDASGTGLRWYATCGYPICGPADAGAPSGVSACTTEKAGASCNSADTMCDPGTGCGVMLRCTDRDPRTQPGGCPISRRTFKRDIHYLDGEDLARLEAQIRAIPLARYRYKDAPSRDRIGFMLEDVSGIPAADEPRDMVDLYSYVSMLVAAVQQQGARLDRQTREIERLRLELARVTRRSSR
jgi:hypothetical protein